MTLYWDGFVEFAVVRVCPVLLSVVNLLSLKQSNLLSSKGDVATSKLAAMKIPKQHQNVLHCNAYHTCLNSCNFIEIYIHVCMYICYCVTRTFSYININSWTHNPVILIYVWFADGDDRIALNSSNAESVNSNQFCRIAAVLIRQIKGTVLWIAWSAICVNVVGAGLETPYGSLPPHIELWSGRRHPRWRLPAVIPPIICVILFCGLIPNVSGRCHRCQRQKQ